MLRHLKNFNELCLYASISCGISFFSRINPSFFLPTILLRLCILIYAFLIIGKTENNRIFGYCLGSAILLGTLGAYWDLIELLLTYNQPEIVSFSSLFLAILGIGYFGYLQYKGK